MDSHFKLSGNILKVTWRELSEISGVARQKVGDFLLNLFENGLLFYEKGVAKERGFVSEIPRVIPISNVRRHNKLC
jgi:hypothetical protein